MLIIVAGGTLSKCLNRGFATLSAGALGFGAKHLASLSGKNGEPIILGILVFLLGQLCQILKIYIFFLMKETITKDNDKNFLILKIF